MSHWIDAFWSEMAKDPIGGPFMVLVFGVVAFSVVRGTLKDKP